MCVCVYVCVCMCVCARVIDHLVHIATTHNVLHLQANTTNTTTTFTLSACQKYNYTLSDANGTDVLPMFPPRKCHASSTGVRAAQVSQLCLSGLGAV